MLLPPPQQESPAAAAAAPTGAYNPDMGRKISRLPAYMEIIRESERRKLLAARRTPLLDRCAAYARDCGRGLATAAAGLATRRRLASGSADGSDTTEQAEQQQHGPSHEELTEEAKCLCRDYICSRLQRSGLLTQKLLDTVSNSTGSSGGSASVLAGGDTSQELRLVGEQLESMYPDLYKNVHKQLNITMNSEEVVRRTYTMFAEQLCSSGIHWGKVVALFAMAGAFAVDCAQQGHQEFIGKIVDCFGSFVSARLCDWLSKQGGWVIPEATRNSKRDNDRTWFWLLLSVGALVLFVSILLISASL